MSGRIDLDLPAVTLHGRFGGIEVDGLSMGLLLRVDMPPGRPCTARIHEGGQGAEHKERQPFVGAMLA